MQKIGLKILYGIFFIILLLVVRVYVRDSIILTHAYEDNNVLTQKLVALQDHLDRNESVLAHGALSSFALEKIVREDFKMARPDEIIYCYKPH